MRVLKDRRWQIFAHFFIILSLFCLTACFKVVSAPFDIGLISSYRDIPGVTQDEIDAIEALREQNASFTYGMMLSTESFITMDGELRGFTALVCEWLEELFGIPFIPQN